jgi:hypothetical protein
MAISTGLWDDLAGGEQVAHTEIVPALGARTAPLPDGLHEGVAQALLQRGLSELYLHQRCL